MAGWRSTPFSNTPTGLAFDNSGSMYIADEFNNRIRKVSGGVISTYAGSGSFTWSGDGLPASPASSFANPTRPGLRQPAATQIISDSNNRRVRKIDTSGNLTTFAGNGLFKSAGDAGQATAANLNRPYGASLDTTGNMFIVDTNSALVRKVSTSGVISTIAGNHNYGFLGGGGSPAANAQLSNFATYSVVDAAGNLYFCDSNNQRVRKIDTAGNISTIAGTGYVRFPPATAVRRLPLFCSI